MHVLKLKVYFISGLRLTQVVTMPDVTVLKDKQFTLDFHDTVHAVEFSQLELFTYLLAVGTTSRLNIVKCVAKVLCCTVPLTADARCCLSVKQ